MKDSRQIDLLIERKLADKVNLEHCEVESVIIALCEEGEKEIWGNLELIRVSTLTFYKSLEAAILKFFIDRHFKFILKSKNLFKTFDINREGKVADVR